MCYLPCPRPRINKGTSVEKIAFLDLEASGLGPDSWPIEVGWCFENGDPETFLIRPSDDWPLDAWDPKAEGLHGLTMAEVTRAGNSIAVVCERLNDVLGDATVFSDAPDWDGFWLYRLFTAAGMKQQFEISNFAGLFDRISSDALNAIIRRAGRISPHRHRARDDVLHMRCVFKLARNEGNSCD